MERIDLSNGTFNVGLEMRVNNFHLTITSQEVTEELAMILDDLEPGKMIIILIVYSIPEVQNRNLIFKSIFDLQYFLENYLYDCYTLNDVSRSYRNFSISEDVIKNKGYYS